MCEPWGSFLVDARGGVFARNGVLSHSMLMNLWIEDQLKRTLDSATAVRDYELGPVGNFSLPEHMQLETNNVHERSNRLFKPEYNWVNRSIDDFNRHDFEENATSRACRAVDDYVEDNFSTSDRFFKWLERGNWLAQYKPEYSRLLRKDLILLPPKKIKVKGCNHSFVTNQTDEHKKIGILLEAKCPTCRLKKSTFIGREKIMEFSKEVIVPYELKKLEIRMRKKGSHYEMLPQCPRELEFAQFADLWKKPENRIQAWQLN